MNSDDKDTLPSYDLSKLNIVGRGALRYAYGSPANFRRLQQQNAARIVEIDADIAQFFPDAHAVNEALRFLVRVTRTGDSIAPREQK